MYMEMLRKCYEVT